jgi:hypothetical protein
MRRVIAILGVAVVLGALMPSRPVIAQAVLTERYEDAACGFSFQYPAGWQRTQADDRRGQAFVTGVTPTLISFGPIRDVPAAQVSTEAIALALAAQQCLDCLRESLVWLDRFPDGSRTVTWIVSRQTVTLSNVNYPYLLAQFFLVDDGTARGLGAGGWTQAFVEFWAPPQEYRQRESEMLAMVRSLRFTRPQVACWS